MPFDILYHEVPHPFTEYHLHAGHTTYSRKFNIVVKTRKIYLCPYTSIPVVSSRGPE